MQRFIHYRSIVNTVNSCKKQLSKTVTTMAKRDDIADLNAIIADSSMDHYYVIHGNFFANHLAHAQVIDHHCKY
jgi:hypothetical protein